MSSEIEIASRGETTCCIVGGGPAGMVLALLLARQGVDVTLLEAHDDFDREFRGDSLHASVMEILAEIGLAEETLKICHARLEEARVVTADGERPAASFKLLKSPFPFVAMIPQHEFLDFLASKARELPGFRLQMGANARRLIEEDGTVQGVIYRQNGELHELRATLTVGADGRASRVRKAAGIELETKAPPMDVVWFQLPRKPEDAEISSAALRFGRGALLVLLDRREHWQAGYVIVKGSFKDLRRGDVEVLRQKIADVVPAFRDRVEVLDDWSKVSVLAVQTGRVRRWHRPGLLLLGDAAHVMSPIGGVGINYAIHDAVAAANLLAEPLRTGRLTDADLAAVQRRREWPTRVVQRFQALMQKRVVTAALKSRTSFRLPLVVRLLIRLPAFRRLLARMIAYGLRPESVKSGLAPLPPGLQP